MKKSLIQIAIDGPAGSGKSTIAKLVADELNIIYVNTGGLFRCYALALKGQDYKNDDVIRNVLNKIKVEMKASELFLNGENVTKEILDVEIGDIASFISKNPIVREKYHQDINNFANNFNVVMEGRDITTVVLPHAKYKIFLTANIDTRSKRRWEQINKTKKLEEIKKQIIERDYADSNRPIAPLTIAKDAIVLDTSEMTIKEVVKAIKDIVSGRDHA